MSESILRVAVCLPAHNESASLPSLMDDIEDLAKSWANVALTVIVFDDGSQDGTQEFLESYSGQHFSLLGLRSLARVGKTLGLSYAFAKAKEEGAQYVFMMDADGQDDPQFLPEMLEELRGGADVVNGRRINRQHHWSKRQASRVFNGLVRLITGVDAFDINSGLKGFSREVLDYLDAYLYGELHRVLLVIAVWSGFRVSEVRVTNRPRTAGHTKYGLARGWRGIFDLVTTQFLYRYQSRPGHLFSGIGLVFLTGSAAFVAAGSLFISDGVSSLQGWIAIAFVCLGFGIVSLGLGFLSELTLFLSRNPRRHVYVITPNEAQRAG